LKRFFGDLLVAPPSAVWDELLTNSSDENYINEFSILISSENFLKSFIIDGLDFFPETNESNFFLNQIKTNKNIQQNIFIDPFINIKFPDICPYQHFFHLILKSLSNQYVFLFTLVQNFSQSNHHPVISQSQTFFNNDPDIFFSISN
jgi:hypothetical protein